MELSTCVLFTSNPIFRVSFQIAHDILRYITIFKFTALKLPRELLSISHFYADTAFLKDGLNFDKAIKKN